MLVDCWDRHYVESHLERTNRIILERIKPLIEACKHIGVTVIHAPSPPIARKYPQWVAYASDAELGFELRSSKPQEWPPADFRKREGQYACFAKPSEPGRDEWIRTEGEARLIAKAIQPQDGEFVIATGAQLHRLCHDRRILHLLYAGFATNMCVPGRDYGTRAMEGRGYNVILPRDCTTGIEGPGTTEEM
ncbi:MAG: cysteine hydrolase family protein, partial [Candidatus Zipacnadales bacterium]